MGHGTKQRFAHGTDQYSAFAELITEPLRTEVGAGELEINDIGLHPLKVHLDAVECSDSLGETSGVIVIFPEPLDVMVNGTLVAHGEVVVVNEKFGIRLTDVISAQERVRKLQ